MLFQIIHINAMHAESFKAIKNYESLLDSWIRWFDDCVIRKMKSI